MSAPFKPKALIYSDFLNHEAGIGNDMRLVILDLENLGISSDYTSFDASKKRRLLDVLRLLLRGPIKLSSADFAYSPHMLPRFYDLPHIVRVHDIFPITNPNWFKLTSRIYFNLSLKSQSQSYYLFDSNTTKKEFVDHFGQLSPNRYSIMYCKTRKLEANRHCGDCSGCKLNSDIKSKSFALAVGTIEPRKNYRFLLDNWSKCFTGDQRILPLYIVGAPGWKSAKILKRLKDKTKNVIWLEKICDSSLRQLYSTATIFVSASKAEGFNLPVKEALSFGTPVILSDISIHRELYENEARFFQLDSFDSFHKVVNESLKIVREREQNNSTNWDSVNDSELTLKRAIESILSR